MQLERVTAELPKGITAINPIVDRRVLDDLSKIDERTPETFGGRLPVLVKHPLNLPALGAASVSDGYASSFEI
jgi:hypothetical protein